MSIGDIGAVIDDLEFDGVICYNPSMVHVAGDVYAVAYEGFEADGWLKTVTIASDGQIADTVIDSYEFDGSSGNHCRIIKIAGNVFAIVYGSSTLGGRVITVTIADNGTITKSVIDSLDYAAWLAFRADIIHIAGNVYAIVARANINNGYLYTFTILSNGQIADTVFGTYKFADTGGYYCKIIHISGQVYAIVYIDGSNDGWIKTVIIADDGGAPAGALDSYEFTEGTLANTEIVHISGSVYAVVYNIGLAQIWIKTVTIANDGEITEPEIDSYMFEGVSGNYAFIIPISGNIFAIAYMSGTPGGALKTIEIANDGQITEPEVSSGAFNATTGEMPFMVHVTGNVYAIAYRGPLEVGLLSTISVETIAPSIPRHELIMGMG